MAVKDVGLEFEPRVTSSSTDAAGPAVLLDSLDPLAVFTAAVPLMLLEHPFCLELFMTELAWNHFLGPLFEFGDLV